MNVCRFSQLLALLCIRTGITTSQLCSDIQQFVRVSQISDYVNATDSLEADVSNYLSSCGFRSHGERSFSRCQKECMLSGDCLALYLSTSLECYTCQPGYSREFEPTESDRVLVIVEQLQRFIAPGNYRNLL